MPVAFKKGEGMKDAKIEVSAEEYVEMLKSHHIIERNRLHNDLHHANESIEKLRGKIGALQIVAPPCLKCGGGHALGRVEWGHNKDMIGVCNKCGQKHSMAIVADKPNYR